MSFLFDQGKEKAHSMLMTQTTNQPTLIESLDQFTLELDKSPLTISAYRSDVLQFIRYLAETDLTVTTPGQVERYHITEYLHHLKSSGRAGVTRARKLISLQVYFSFLVKSGGIPHSPAVNIDRPKKERRPKDFLRPEEYNKLLVQAAGDPRDYAMLQVFLQTGIRVSELVAIKLADLDMEDKTLAVHGKGEKERTIPLEKKAMQALKSWLTVRPKVQDQRLFLTYQGTGFSIRGVRKLVDKYLTRAAITKKISCHGLRRTCLTNKAARNMNAFAIQKLAGHERMETTRIYVQLGTEDLRPMMEATSL
jgi:site-specific recombinase XerD